MSRQVKPSPAELVRTLVRGRLPGELHIGGERAPLRICHSTDAAGRPLVLARDIHVTEYTTAEPDPLHELERDLLLDLADHHTERVGDYFRFLLAVAGVPCCRTPPRAVRLDRYGFVVDTAAPAHRWVRLDFHRPVHCHHELARLLHPVLFHKVQP